MQNGHQDVIQPKLSYIGGGTVKGTSTWENSLVVLFKAYIHLTVYEPAITIPAICPRKIKS